MEQTDHGDEEFDNWLEAEKTWLNDASEDQWIAYAENVIWEDGGWVLDWMLDQPQCTKQVAAAIFWACGTEYSVEQELKEQDYFDPNVRVEDMVADKVLKLWRAGRFTTGMAHYIGKGDSYRALLDRYPEGRDPLNVPADLLNGFQSKSEEARRRAEVLNNKGRGQEASFEPDYRLGFTLMAVSVISLIGIAWLKSWI